MRSRQTDDAVRESEGGTIQSFVEANLHVFCGPSPKKGNQLRVGRPGCEEAHDVGFIAMSAEDIDLSFPQIAIQRCNCRTSTCRQRQGFNSERPGAFEEGSALVIANKYSQRLLKLPGLESTIGKDLALRAADEVARPKMQDPQSIRHGVPL